MQWFFCGWWEIPSKRSTSSRVVLPSSFQFVVPSKSLLIWLSFRKPFGMARLHLDAVKDRMSSSNFCCFMRFVNLFCGYDRRENCINLPSLYINCFPLRLFFFFIGFFFPYCLVISSLYITSYFSCIYLWKHWHKSGT